ncbi:MULTISPECIES: hypothetical protein [Bacillus]|nr:MULTISPECIES: hypothetical protein [Bacillus cereus group]
MENFDFLLAVQNGFIPQGMKLDSGLLKQTLKYEDVISMKKVNFVRKLGLKKNV